jgi:hypothetical protein
MSVIADKCIAAGKCLVGGGAYFLHMKITLCTKMHENPDIAFLLCVR